MLRIVAVININMGEEKLKTKTVEDTDYGSISSSLFAFDLPSLIETMKNNHTWVKGELNAMILFDNPDKKIILATLHEGTEIKSFQSSDSFSLQIIEGVLNFSSPEESVTLNKGQLLVFRKKMKYSLTTSEETVLLMSITNEKAIRVEN